MLAMHPRSLFLLGTMCAVATIVAAQKHPPATCTSAENGELQLQHFQSTVFPYPQTLRVWLPPGYHDAANAERRYPVLYMFDGQNLFTTCASGPDDTWKIDTTLTQLIAQHAVEPIIVVGVDAPDFAAKRASELLPIPDTIGPFHFVPHGDRLPEMLTTEVMPRIEHAYRVQTGRASTAVGGASYGGVAALYVLKTLPGTFGLGLVESPSGSPGNGEIARWTQDLYEPPLRVALGVGDTESFRFRQMIVQLGLDPDQEDRNFARISRTVAENLRSVMGSANVRFVEAPHGTHSEDEWARRFGPAVTFLFPAK